MGAAGLVQAHPWEGCSAAQPLAPGHAAAEAFAVQGGLCHADRHPGHVTRCYGRAFQWAGT